MKILFLLLLSSPVWAGYWKPNTCAAQSGSSSASSVTCTWSTTSPAASPVSGEGIFCQASVFGSPGTTFTVTDSASNSYTSDGAQVTWLIGATLNYTQIFHFVNLSSTITSVTLSVSPAAQFPAIVCSSFVGATTPYNRDLLSSSGTVTSGVITVSGTTTAFDATFCASNVRSGGTMTAGAQFFSGSTFNNDFLNEVRLEPTGAAHSWTVSITQTSGGMACLAFNTPANATLNVTLDGGSSGRTFEGIGGVSAGASSRLLTDYPTQQKGEILDYLFKPNYGASLHRLKVEIGGDMNSTDGSEASHERSSGVIDCSRGYEWYLMQQAIARNESLVLGSLMWGTAGWVSAFYSAANITYVKDWLTCAANNGLSINYTGIWNETSPNTQWTKDLKNGLVAGAYSTNVVTSDEVAGLSHWGIASTVNGDATLKADVSAVTQHYMSSVVGGGYPTSTAKALNKPLWDSEDGSWPQGVSSTWAAAGITAKILNQNYVEGLLTATDIWALFTGYYDTFPIPGAGLMTANTPWSGNYSVSPSMWAVAQTTQFSQPGWQYLDPACAYIYSATQGSYVALKSGSGYSVIIETIDANAPQDFTFTMTGGLATGTVHVWKTTSAAQFIQQSDIVPSSGVFSITIDPGAIYSLTTTTGQAKGSASPPGASNFPFPYQQNFESPGIGNLATYMATVVGAFEIGACSGRSGNCLQQTVTTTPIPWASAGGMPPATLVGDSSRADYLVTSDVNLLQAGTVTIYGRITSQPQKSAATGYTLNVDDTGAWTLKALASTLASGSIGSFGTNTWHTLQLKFSGTSITAFADGNQIANVTNSTYAAGMAGVGVGGYTSSQFDNFGVCDVSTGCPAQYAGGSSAGGNARLGGTASVH